MRLKRFACVLVFLKHFWKIFFFFEKFFEDFQIGGYIMYDMI